MTSAALCDGIISTDPSSGAAICSTGWYSVAYNAVVPFDISTLDPMSLVNAFGSGFFMLAGVWCACKGCEIVLGLIRKG